MSIDPAFLPLSILIVLYSAVAGIAAVRLKRLHRKSPQMNICKLYVMSCFLCCLLRVLSFASLMAMILNNIEFSRVHDGDDNLEQDDTGDSDFFNKALLVLFDFPDYSIVSAYVLLTVVWAESFLQVNHKYVNE